MRVDRTGNNNVLGEIGWFDWFRGGHFYLFCGLAYPNHVEYQL
jgi:hypothetical protein